MAKESVSDYSLNIKDRKLLYYLSRNSRESYTQLAKKVGLSKNAVYYKIEALKKQGIIKNFSSVIHLGALGKDTFTMFLKFNQDIYKDKRIMNYFREYEFVDWLITLSGDWDLFVEFVFKDLEHMTQIINQITSEFKNQLNTYEVLFSNQPIKVEHLIPDFYKDLKLPELEKSERKFESYKTDKVDKKLLSLLASDSSLNSVVIAEKLNLTLDVVRYRIKKLVSSGIIIKFFPELALDKLGYQEYLCKIKLRNSSQLESDKIKLELRTNFNVTYAFFDVISSSFVFVCAFKSPNQIDTLLRSLRSKFSEVIESQSYLIIKEQVLFNLFPRGLINL